MPRAIEYRLRSHEPILHVLAQEGIVQRLHRVRPEPPERIVDPLVRRHRGSLREILREPRIHIAKRLRLHDLMPRGEVDLQPRAGTRE